MGGSKTESIARMQWLINKSIVQCELTSHHFRWLGECTIVPQPFILKLYPDQAMRDIYVLLIYTKKE